MYSFKRYKPHYSRILRLALPVVLAQAGQLTTQFADTAMVGQFGGDNPIPLAAVSLGSSLFLLIYLAVLGLALGITPIVGESYARNDRREVSRIFANGILYCLLLGVGATIAAIAIRPFIGVLQGWMSSSGGDVEAVAEMALPYYDMLVWSIVPMTLFLAVKQFLEGIGNTKVAMWTTLGGNVLNIGLNYNSDFWALWRRSYGCRRGRTRYAHIAHCAGHSHSVLLLLLVSHAHIPQSLRAWLARCILPKTPIKHRLSHIVSDGIGVGCIYPNLDTRAVVRCRSIERHAGIVQHRQHRMDDNSGNRLGIDNRCIAHLWCTTALRTTPNHLCHLPPWVGVGSVHGDTIRCVSQQHRRTLYRQYGDHSPHSTTHASDSYISTLGLDTGTINQHVARYSGRENHHAHSPMLLPHTQHSDRVYARLPLPNGVHGFSHRTNHRIEFGSNTDCPTPPKSD